MLLFVVCAVMCVGCGNSQDKPNNPDEPNNPTVETESIIALTDAVNEIQMALAINGNDNHSILEKIGNFDYTCQIELCDDETTPEDVYQAGIYHYANYDFVTYNSETSQGQVDNKTRKVYFANGVEYVNYVKYGNDIHEQTNKNVINVELFNTAFSVDAFNFVYDSEVKKVTNADGISYTLKSDLKGVLKLINLVSGKSIGEDFEEQWLELKNKLSQDVLDECYMSVIIEVDLYGTITTAEIDWVYVMSEDCYKYKENYRISKTTNQVTQPQWVTDYLASKN